MKSKITVAGALPPATAETVPLRPEMAIWSRNTVFRSRRAYFNHFGFSRPHELFALFSLDAFAQYLMRNFLALQADFALALNATDFSAFRF